LPGTIWPVHFDLMIYPARFLVAVALLFTASSFARDYRLSLAAPTADFAGQVISFRLPADAAKPVALRDASGKIIPLQTDADGTAATKASHAARIGSAANCGRVPSTTICSRLAQGRPASVLSKSKPCCIAVAGPTPRTVCRATPDTDR
jgi:hypothetical protein